MEVTVKEVGIPDFLIFCLLVTIPVRPIKSTGDSSFHCLFHGWETAELKDQTKIKQARFDPGQMAIDTREGKNMLLATYPSGEVRGRGEPAPLRAPFRCGFGAR